MSMYEKRKALLIGINEYDSVSSLRGCENDVRRMEEVLQTHEGGNPNFTTRPLLNVTNEKIKSEIQQLLKREATTALLYFSGHGNVTNDGGFIWGKDTSKSNPGVSMEWIVDQLNKSSIPELVIILDCCYAGTLSNEEMNGNISTRLRKGVTILAATGENDTAEEFLGRGLFTSILYDGLNGAAQDVLGHVTAASLYSNAEFILSAWEQRPVFKLFVKQLTPLRFCLPREDKQVLRGMLKHPFFPSMDAVIQLDIRMLYDETVGDFGPDEVYALAAFEKAGLINCSNGVPLLQAIKENGTCSLSPYGKHVWGFFNKKLA